MLGGMGRAPWGCWAGSEKGGSSEGAEGKRTLSLLMMISVLCGYDLWYLIAYLFRTLIRYSASFTVVDSHVISGILEGTKLWLCSCRAQNYYISCPGLEEGRNPCRKRKVQTPIADGKTRPIEKNCSGLMLTHDETRQGDRAWPRIILLIRTISMHDSSEL